SHGGAEGRVDTSSFPAKDRAPRTQAAGVTRRGWATLHEHEVGSPPNSPNGNRRRGGLPAGWAADVSLQDPRRGESASTIRFVPDRSARLTDVVFPVPADAQVGSNGHTTRGA